MTAAYVHAQLLAALHELANLAEQCLLLHRVVTGVIGELLRNLTEFFMKVLVSCSHRPQISH